MDAKQIDKIEQFDVIGLGASTVDILSLVDHLPAEWASPDLAQEQKKFQSKVMQIFPELDEVAANSLACRWSYSWR